MTQTGLKIAAAPQMITDVNTAKRLANAVGVQAQAGEHYTATRLERELWAGVLEAVATGNAQSGYLAAAAMTTAQIDFPRTALR